LELTVVPCEAERLSELFRLRASVWVEEGANASAFPAGSWSDAADADRTHWMVLDQGRIVAGASLGLHDTLADLDEPEAYLSIPAPPPGIIAAPQRVVVDRQYRGRGIAAALLDAQDRASKEAGAVIAVRQASPAMKRILDRRGWRDHGPGPMDPRFPGIQFTVMSLLISDAV